MRKIRLDIDALAVESFSSAGGEAQPGGTVRGHEQIPTLETGHHGCYGCLGSGLPTCAACS